MVCVGFRRKKIHAGEEFRYESLISNRGLCWCLGHRLCVRSHPNHFSVFDWDVKILHISEVMHIQPFDFLEEVRCKSVLLLKSPSLSKIYVQVVFSFSNGCHRKMDEVFLLHTALFFLLAHFCSWDTEILWSRKRDKVPRHFPKLRRNFGTSVFERRNPRSQRFLSEFLI